MRDCIVIQDLWPLYLDGELSDETKQYVEEHISQCTHCQKIKNAGPGVEFAELLENPGQEPGSPEKFMLKLKRRLQRLVAGLVNRKL